MIVIRCAQLESVRKNPVAYGQLLASNETKQNGGSHGMFACFKDAARTVHIKNRTVSEAIKDMQGKFFRFVDNPQNKSKQSLLTEQFVSYNNKFEKMGFEMIDGNRQMRWDILPGGRLSGLTPWVVEDAKGGYYSYILTEKTFDWQSELRFSLFQKYISDNTVKCKSSDLNIGIYDLSKGEFQFTSFTIKEIANSVSETVHIFNTVKSHYKK